MREIKVANPDGREEIKKILNKERDPEEKYETYYAAKEEPKVANPDGREEIKKILNKGRDPEEKDVTYYAEEKEKPMVVDLENGR